MKHEIYYLLNSTYNSLIPSFQDLYPPYRGIWRGGRFVIFNFYCIQFIYYPETDVRVFMASTK